MLIGVSFKKHLFLNSKLSFVDTLCIIYSRHLVNNPVLWMLFLHAALLNTMIYLNNFYKNNFNDNKKYFFFLILVRFIHANQAYRKNKWGHIQVIQSSMKHQGKKCSTLSEITIMSSVSFSEHHCIFLFLYISEYLWFSDLEKMILLMRLIEANKRSFLLRENIWRTITRYVLAIIERRNQYILFHSKILLMPHYFLIFNKLFTFWCYLLLFYKFT